MMDSALERTGSGWRSTAARLVSRVLNPFLMTVTLLIVAAWARPGPPPALLNWLLVILVTVVAMPFAYVYIRTARRGGRMHDPLPFFRQNSKDVMIVATSASGLCAGLLLFLRAPPVLIAALVVSMITSLGVAAVSRFVRASYHILAVTNLAILVMFLWGERLWPVLLLVPLLGWARYSLHKHTLVQMAVGFAVAAAITPAVLYLVL